MKVVVQNPQLTSDTWTSGINDYVVEYLRMYRPAVRIWPARRLVRWFRFLVRKGLPLHGWEYIWGPAALKNCDAWISFNGTASILHDVIPKEFQGLKLYHVMDYTFRSLEAGRAFRSGKLDFLLGYARHDQWCRYFASVFPDYENRVIPVPFGYGPRFRCVTGFEARTKKCVAMGSVNPVQDPMSDARCISSYVKFFEGVEWAHGMRQIIRANVDSLDGAVDSYLPVPPMTKNTSYNSAAVLNKYQLFVNDDSIMHYPPARTYEGPACGTVMVCSDHPCYDDFGWQDGVNCLKHRAEDLDDFLKVVRDAVDDQARLRGLHEKTVERSRTFSHRAIARGLQILVESVWNGERMNFADCWRRFNVDPIQESGDKR